MKTIISHNSKNQLFATRQQAIDALVRNGYDIGEVENTLPCSFDEKERIHFDVNRDDVEEIKAYVILDDEEDDVILYGFWNEYVVRNKETGEIIEHVRKYTDGVNLIAELDKQYLIDGKYISDLYKIVPYDNYVVSEDEVWFENWIKSLPNKY